MKQQKYLPPSKLPQRLIFPNTNIYPEQDFLGGNPLSSIMVFLRMLERETRVPDLGSAARSLPLPILPPWVGARSNPPSRTRHPSPGTRAEAGTALPAGLRGGAKQATGPRVLPLRLLLLLRLLLPVVGPGAGKDEDGGPGGAARRRGEGEAAGGRREGGGGGASSAKPPAREEAGLERRARPACPPGHPLPRSCLSLYGLGAENRLQAPGWSHERGRRGRSGV